VPGGNRAPYGIVREGRPSTLRIDEPKAAVVRRCYELSAAGATDWEVAAQIGLRKTHVAEILTNPIYAGRLRTGEPAGVPAIVEAGLWSAVQNARERRRTRTPGRIVKRNYALRLRCAGCGRFLFGDVGRYRHPTPTCLPFRSATPVGSVDRRAKGHSYPQAWYEAAVGGLLAEIGRVDDHTITEVVRLHASYEPRTDELALARLDREREEAARTLTRTRDYPAWQATMARLDAEDAVLRQPTEARRLTPPEIVDYLRALPRLWADSGPDGKQALAVAIFARLDVLGYQRLEYELTPDAMELGLDGALPPFLELDREVAGFGRGERI
jgi:hypothetical protein